MSTGLRTGPAAPTRGGVTARGRRWWPVVAFVAVAFALAWLVALPLWLTDGLASPWFPVVAVAMMTTPTVAAVVLVLLQRPRERARALGLWPLRPARRLLGYGAAGVVVSIALVLVALPVGALLGVYPADFVHFSAFQQVLDEQAAGTGSGGLPVSTGTLVALQLLTLPLSAVINLLPALGEEIGWRGWLLPRLMPLGTLPALLVSGVVWGLWHAPLILLGYNYPDAPGWLGLTSMVIMCTLVGAVFGWLRLRSGTVWPAALAHAAFNGAGGTFLLFAMAGEHVDTTQATILGWSGWIVPAVLVVVLLATGQLTPTRAAHPGPDADEARGA